MMTSQRWAADKIIKFIGEYKRNECLWDPNHPQYKVRDAREAAYKEIMVAMEMETVKEVIMKIRTFRNTYNNETLKTKKSSMGTVDQLYVSKIPWLHHFDFIKNIDNCSSDNTDNGMSNITQENPAHGFVIPEYSSHFTLIRNKRKSRYVTHPFERVSTHHYSNRASNDEFDLFGKTIAEQLRKLPLGIALETEETLLSVIRQQRMKIAEEGPMTGSESAWTKWTTNSHNINKLFRQQQTVQIDDERFDEDILQKTVDNILETDPNYYDIDKHISDY